MHKDRATSDLRRAVGRFLADLGPTPFEVATSLARLGCEIGRDSVDPVRDVLWSLLGVEPGIRRVRLTRRHLVITRRAPWPFLVLRLPAPVSALSAGYRGGGYDPILGRSPTASPLSPFRSLPFENGK